MYRNWIGKSSQIISTNYNTEKKELVVEFKTGTYRYLKVPAEVNLALVEADSVGRFINEKIKPIYQVIKIK